MPAAPSRKLFKQYNSKGTEDLNEWRTRFVAVADPTEYMGGIELCGSWQEWQDFKRHWPEFTNKILIDWLAEIEVKLRSDAILNLCVQASGATGTAAAKWIAEGRHKPNKVGAPSKLEVERQAKIQARVNNETEDDIARVMASRPEEHKRMN